MLADAAAVGAVLGVRVDSTDPESTIGERPSERLHELYRQARGYRRSAAFDKEIDGVELMARVNLETARRNAPSLDRLLTLLGN